MFDAEKNVASVHITDIGHGQHRPRHIDSLMIGYKTAVDHPADNIIAGDFLHSHLNQSVVDQYRRSHTDIIFQILIGDGRSLPGTHNLVCRQNKSLTTLKHHSAALKIPQADFRPLGIQKRGHRQSQFLSHFQYSFVFYQLLLMRPM